MAAAPPVPPVPPVPPPTTMRSRPPSPRTPVVLITIAYADGSKPLSELYVESLMPQALLERVRENPFAPRWRDVLDGARYDARESFATVSQLAEARVQDWAPHEGVPYQYHVVFVASYATEE